MYSADSNRRTLLLLRSELEKHHSRIVARNLCDLLNRLMLLNADERGRIRVSQHRLAAGGSWGSELSRRSVQTYLRKLINLELISVHRRPGHANWNDYEINQKNIENLCGISTTPPNLRAGNAPNPPKIRAENAPLSFTNTQRVLSIFNKKEENPMPNDHQRKIHPDILMICKAFRYPYPNKALMRFIVQMRKAGLSKDDFLTAAQVASGFDDPGERVKEFYRECWKHQKRRLRAS